MRRDKCPDCDFVFSAVSQQALNQAWDAHVAYINTRDPQTDPHFEAQRLDRLIAR